MRILVISCFMTTQLALYGQVVNIENRRIYEDTSGISGAVDAGFSTIQTASLLLSTSLRPRIQYKTEKHYYLFLTDWRYTKSTNQVYANSGMAHFRYAYRLGKGKKGKKSPWKWESYAQIQYNQLLDQRNRSLLGTGLRLKILDRKGYRIFVGSSTFFEYERIQSSNLIIRDYRWSNYISCYINPIKTFSFTGVTYIQPLWRDFNDFRFMGQYTLAFHLLKSIDFRVEVMCYYDENPPKDVINWTFNSDFGVRVNLN